MAANKRVTRAVYAAFIALAAAFIAASVYNVATQLFGPPSAGNPTSPRVSAPCGEAIRALVAAIDRAHASAAAIASPDEADQAYAEGKKPEWARPRHDELTRACESDPNGLLALATVARLDRAAEAWVHRRKTELGPVRREVDSFIR